MLWLLLPVERIFSFNEFLGFHLCVCVSHFNLTFRAAGFLKFFNITISGLQDLSCCFSERVWDNATNWSLWSVGSSVWKGFVRKRNTSILLKGGNTKRNPSVMSLPIFIIVLSCYTIVHSGPFIKFQEISWIVYII